MYKSVSWCSRGRLGLRRFESAAFPALAGFFALFRRHLFPPFLHAFSHSFRHAFSYAVTHVPFSAARSPPATEQNPAEKQQSQRLPERNQAPSEQRRQQPIPQMHHNLAANDDEQCHRQNRQRSNPNPSFSHAQSLPLMNSS